VVRYQFKKPDSCYQAVDKVGRTARRAADTHLKNALAKPRVATSLRRMTAIFSFATDLRGFILSMPHFVHLTPRFGPNFEAPILVNAEKPELQAHAAPVKARKSSPIPAKRRASTPDPSVRVETFILVS
jgi:hypothetical protein